VRRLSFVDHVGIGPYDGCFAVSSVGGEWEREGRRRGVKKRDLVTVTVIVTR